MEYFEVLCGIFVAILALYYYFTSTFDFWNSRGVPGPRPIPFFGNFKDIILSKKPMNEYLTNLYNTYKDEPMIGIFVKRQPILILRDLDLIKNVLIRDFTVFPTRRTENIFEKVCVNNFELLFATVRDVLFYHITHDVDRAAESTSLFSGA